MNNEQSITLLRRNKRLLAEAFQSVGMADVTESSRAAEFAKRIKWAGGLLDLCLACQRISDGSHWYFTQSEWETLTNANKQLFLMRGLRVRALGHSFVLAPTDVKDEEGNSQMQWMNASVDIPDLENVGIGAAYNDFSGKASTALILEVVANENIPSATSAPAAQWASAYHSYRKEDGDALDDESDWHLPGLGVLIVLYRYRSEINKAFSAFWGSDALLQNDRYWSSSEWNNAYKWYIGLGDGLVNNADPITKYRVRPVSDEV